MEVTFSKGNVSFKNNGVAVKISGIVERESLGRQVGLNIIRPNPTQIWHSIDNSVAGCNKNIKQKYIKTKSTIFSSGNL